VNLKQIKHPRSCNQPGFFCREQKPHLVRGDKGEIDSLQYRELIPLMLNEMQHQQNEMQHQQTALTILNTQNQMLAQQNAPFAALLERLERASRRR
jgi:hypothetical protein